MKAVAVLMLALAGTAFGARHLSATTYPILENHKPMYNVLNYTGWDDYPEGCWVFPLPALNVVIDDVVYLMSANTPDAAQAWCEYNGFEGVGETSMQDFSEGQTVRTVDFASGDVCEGVGAPAGAGAPCSAYKYIECVKNGATAGCSRRFSTNYGVDNMGYGNGTPMIPGATNVGNWNDGSTNLGDFNIGSANVGSLNQGSANYGNCNMGSAIKGDFVNCPIMPTTA